MTSMTGAYAKCELECLTDDDCPLLHYCCPNGCGRLCVPLQVDDVEACGCSVTFITPAEEYHEYEDDDFNVVGVNHLVWETLSESFTPALEPYIVQGVFELTSLGPMATKCSFKRGIEFGTDFIEYTAFKRPERILIIISDDPEFYVEIAAAPLSEIYKTVCAVSVGNISIDKSLMKQLSIMDNDQPCLWTVDSFERVGDFAPSISSIVNDGRCLCGGVTKPSSPCKVEGETCTKDSECDQPTHVCVKGSCSRVSCSQPETFNPEPADDYDDYNYDFYFYHYDDFGIESEFFYKTYVGFYDDYDYFFRDDFPLGTRMSEGSRKMGESGNKLSRGQKVATHKESGNRGNALEPTKTQNRVSELFSMLADSSAGCCAFNQFQCSGVPAVCISDNRVCDAVNDCFNNDDETPEACAKRMCDDRWFKCTSGQCIAKKLRCDGIKNCPDGSDENCSRQADCPSTRPHYCSSGECINFRNICDGKPDCKSGEDEVHCRCKGYKCPSGECVFDYKVCDGYHDCPDGSDEYCSKNNISCPPGRSFRCENGQCIRETFACNMITNCVDSTDETVAACIPMYCFYCNSGQCIFESGKCDGVDDCDDRSDETMCKNSRCGKGMFLCKSGECLKELVKCNNREECADGSDELVCDKCPDLRPLRCSSGECIDYSMVCDGKYDCTDKSDESKCLNMACPGDRPEKCESGQCRYDSEDCLDGSDTLRIVEPICNGFKCKSGECGRRCDGYRDCEDGSDEEDCKGMPCPDETDFRCKSGECISYNDRCDLIKECNDGSDEEDCLDYKCPFNYFSCTSGPCVYTTLCSGINDCLEKQCKQTTDCLSHRSKCTSGQCIYKYGFCDGIRQCFDGSDEDNCQNITCPDDRSFHCKSGVCRQASQRCDGFISCEDGSDEENCQNYTCPSYRSHSCPSGICISVYQLCNGVDDCGDGSDEMDCANHKCPEKAFKCKKGNCILPKYRCDGEYDCDGGEDELDCENSESQNAG